MSSGEDGGTAEQSGADRERHRRADAVEQAAGDRPDDGRDLPRRGRQGDGRGERLGRHEVGDQRLLGGIEKGAGDAEDEENGEDRPDRGRAAQDEDEQGSRAQRFRAQADRDDDAAVVAVGGGAGDQHQKQRRRELDEADDAEIERIAGEVVDLPADGDADDLGGEGGGEPRHPQQGEAAMAKRGPGRLGRVGIFGRGHGDSSGVFGEALPLRPPRRPAQPAGGAQACPAIRPQSTPQSVSRSVEPMPAASISAVRRQKMS